MHHINKPPNYFTHYTSKQIKTQAGFKTTAKPTGIGTATMQR
jgi:hypothetical protein